MKNYRMAGLGGNMGTVEITRRGGKYEAAGFFIIIGGMGVCLASGALGAMLMAVGFAVFLVGRFM
jgi:hypothetical protein